MAKGEMEKRRREEEREGGKARDVGKIMLCLARSKGE